MKVLSFLFISFLSLSLLGSYAAPDSISYFMKDGHRVIIYEVEAGESLYSISKKYGVSVEDIISFNPNLKDEKIREGQIIKIPRQKPNEQLQSLATEFRVHKVKKGETLYSISRKYGVEVSALVSANKGLDPDYLKEGQELKIPGKSMGLSNEKDKEEVKKEQKKQQDEESKTKQKNGKLYSFPTKKNGKENYQYHTVEPGETMYAISRKYDVKVTEIMDWNDLENFQIDVGQQLIVGVIRGEKNEKREDPEPKGGEFMASDNDEEEPPTDHKNEVVAEDEKDEPETDDEWEVEEKPKFSEKEDFIPRETLISLEYKEHLSTNEYKELTQKSIARWMKNVDGYPAKNGYFALHKSLPIGTIIKVKNPVNGRVVFAKVIGHLPNAGENKEIQMKLPKSASEELKAFDDVSMLEISYLQELNGKK